MNQTNRAGRINRRRFLQQTSLAIGAAGGLLGGCSTSGQKVSKSSSGQSIFYLINPADPVASSVPVKWALENLGRSLAARRVALRPCPHSSRHEADDDTCVWIGDAASMAVAGDFLRAARVSVASGQECAALLPLQHGSHHMLAVCGSDARGLVYALTDLADRIDHSPNVAAALDIPQPIVERPANRIRGIMRLFASDVEDKAWFNDKEFWRGYLTMLVSNRFNRFNLALGLGYDFTSGIRDAYFHFPYPFLLDVPGYAVRASNLSSEERDRNLAMLRFISDQAAIRGLHFQLGLWTHAYQWTNSPDANHVIEGLTPDHHAAYCRDALELLLRSCPSISGVTFRIHGESGVAEGNYDFWKTIFDGAVRCGRKVEIDMHAKGMDQPMIDVALATGLPVNISPKFWAEHMGLPYPQAAIRSTERPVAGRNDEGFFAKSSGSRSFLRYGYGDLLKEDRRYGVLHRIWPGTQRLLLWGSPAMAAAYGRASSFCGSIGVELFEPLSFKGRKGSGLPGGRDGYADISLKCSNDWEKYAYSYRLWGRLLYNPDADPQTWRRLLRTDYGPAAEPAEKALAHASRILPLITTAHCPSAANNNYWPEIYANMSIVDASRPGPYGDTPSPKRFGTVSPLDPQLFSSIDDFADELLNDKQSAKYSPAEVAQWLHDLANVTSLHMAAAERASPDRNAPAFRRLAIDIAIQSGIGLFFAWKLRAGLLYALYDRTGHPSVLQEAIKAYRSARQAWAELAHRADGAYARDITFGGEKQIRGHWSDRLAAIDQDIAAMEKQQPRASAKPIAAESVAAAIQAILVPPPRPDLRLNHTAPNAFQRGKPVLIELTLPQPAASSVDLHFRHVNQAEPHQSAGMQLQDGRYQATIPAGYTDSPYPLQYYFELRIGPGQALLYPGFNSNLSNTPYVILRSA